MNGELWYLGMSHDRAPLGIREALRPDAGQRRAMLERLGAWSAGRMILSTCERFELYAHAPQPVDINRWINSLHQWFHLPRSLLRRYVRVRRGPAVSAHLLRVSAGLASRVPGEPQILGQVRMAYSEAGEAQAMDAILSALGRFAIRAGRRVRHETTLNRGGRSIATLAVECVLDGLDRPNSTIVANDHSPGPHPANGHTINTLDALVSRHSIAVIGSGRMAFEVADELQRRRAANVTVVGRDTGRSASLAGRTAAHAAPWGSLRHVLRRADAAIVCTAAPSFVIDGAVLPAAGGKLKSIVDLSVPRNVDPAVACLPGLHLVDLDTLLAEPRPLQSGIAAAEAVVAEEWEAFHTWWQQRSVAGRIAELVRQSHSAPSAADPEQRRELHQRIMRIKQEVAA